MHFHPGCEQVGRAGCSVLLCAHTSEGQGEPRGWFRCSLEAQPGLCCPEPSRGTKSYPHTQLVLKGSRALHPACTWSHGKEIPFSIHWWRLWSAGDSSLKRSHTFVALNHKINLFLSVGLDISFDILHCCHLVLSRLRRQY